MLDQTLFNVLMKKYPLLKDDIKTNLRHVNNPDFDENKIVKIKTNQEVSLFHDEKEAVQVFSIKEIDKDVVER